MIKSELTPADPDFERRVRESFSRQSAMKTLGVTMASVEAGAVELEMPFQKSMGQQHGFQHAGVIATVMDSAAGYAALTLMPEDSAVLTVEFKANFMSPAKGDRFRFKAKVIKAGKTITVCEAKALSEAGGETKLIAALFGTMMAVRDRGIAG